MLGHEVHRCPVEPHRVREDPIAEPASVLDDHVEDRLDIGGRAADDP
jgi:hypothetical protein